LMLLEFDDRLRVCISSANAMRLHWCFRNEVVWVQDFPLASRTRGMRELHSDGPFGWTLAATLAELLKDCSGDRQKFWVSTLAKFDFTGTTAALIVSQPGWARPVAASPCFRHSGESEDEARGEEEEVQIPLRIRAKVVARQEQVSTPDESNESWQGFTFSAMETLSVAPLRKELEHWELHHSGSEEGEPSRWAFLVDLLPPLKRRREQRERLRSLLAVVDEGASLRALRAAENLGFSISEDIEVDDEQDGTWTLHLKLIGQLPAGAWSQMCVDLLTCLEMNLGCMALRQRLSCEVWPSSEEVHFTALSPTHEGYDSSFYDSLDEAVGCPATQRMSMGFPRADAATAVRRPPPPSRPPPPLPPPVAAPAAGPEDETTELSPPPQPQPPVHSAHQPPVPLLQNRTFGLQVLAPPGSDEVEETYLNLQNMGRLAMHEDPGRNVGRSRVHNHSKIIARQFCHPVTRSSYGWIYVGSHNLTKAAWGRTADAGCIGGDPTKRIWIGNRELGVLLVEPRDKPQVGASASPGRSEDTSLFARAPLPFGIPPGPCRDIEQRGVYPYEEHAPEEEDEDEAWPDDAWGNSWQSNWHGWREWEGTTDWQRFADSHRVLPSSSWWWWR